MNKFVKKGFCLVLATGLIASSFAGCAKINYVTNGAIQAIHEIKDGSWENAGKESEGAVSESDFDKPVIDEFVEGTFGGVEFKSVADVANYYVEAYNYTKTLTAKYKDADGKTVDWYKMLGEEKLTVGNIKIDGKGNSVIDNMVPGIVGGLYSPGLNGLPPSTSPCTTDDTDEWGSGGESVTTSRLVPEDLVTANVTDNGDGTITLVMQPKSVNMSVPGKDAQGHMFQSLGAIDEVVDSISVLSWTEGTTKENCKVNYYGGTATVTIDTKTKEIVKAEYIMNAYVNVTHASIAVIKDKSATVDVTYNVTFPATDKYLSEAKGVSRIK